MDLEQIKKRFEKVQDQEWVYSPEKHCRESQVLCSFDYKPDNTTLILASYYQHANGNGEFIGHAKDDMGFLIAKIERMQSAILESVSFDYIDRIDESIESAASVILDVGQLRAFFDVEVKNE